MNNALRDTEARSYRECLLPSMARTSSITQVMPAKKITFFKRGDPQFSGVRLAVHQRTFKSFTALMDELSQRMPLSFGVRSVTTPQGLHCLTTLEQLEDGGCYLCSDKKHPQVLSGSGRLQRRHLSAQPLEDFKGRCEVPGTSSSWKDPKAPKRIILVKNTDPRFQRTVVLSHRNTRSLTAFLSKASDLLHFPVKQVFTISGKKVDSLQNLLNSPLVLVCAGHESFRPPSMEDSKRNGTETLSGLTSRNKNGSWGLKTKQSIIHSRSKSGSRSRRFSLLSEKSGLSDPSVSLHHTWMGSALHWHPRDTPVHTGPLVADNDFEKKVHMNEDGSLSVEMKVRFHLFNEDTLLWSTGVRRASTLTTASGERVDQGEVDHLHCVWKGSPGSFSEPGALGLKPCESGGEEAFNQGQQAWPSYEIWTNPLYRSQVEEIDSGKRAQLTQHSRPSWSQGAASRKRTSKASVSSASNDRPAAGSEPNSYCPRSLEGSMGSCREHQASRAASKRGAEQEAGCIPQAGNGDLQAEESGQSTGSHKARCGSVKRLPMALGHSRSWDAEGCSFPLSSCASVQRRRRKQKSQASAVSLPNISGFGSNPPAVISAIITPVSNSDPQKRNCASHFYHPHFTSAESDGNPDLEGKISGEEENLEEQEDSVMMLSALPHISPEILVYEWLSHIPEDPILLKYEMMEESPNVAGNGPETTQDDPVYKQSLEDLGELAQSREQPLEGETSDRPELYEPPVTDDASSKSEEALSQREASRYVSDACAEARASNRTIVGHGVGEGVLPSRIPASIQIMKTLISSKQGRPSSLPEVSSVVGQRLSHSACALITCLARLHFFDKDFGSPSKVRFTDSPQFQELLATFKSLWPPCNELDLDHQEIRSCQVLPGFTSHAVTEDFTPTSSSGVDVSSGSGGSGEGSGPCPVECTLTSERMELPLKVVTGIISYQRPDSRTSEHPEYLRNQHLSCSKASSNSQALACITSQDEAGENSREQMLGNSLDQLVENTVHEEGVQEKKIKEEIEKEEMPEEQSKEEEFPEEKSIKEQELSVNDTQDGEGTQEDMKMQKEEAGRDPDSVDLCPPEMSNKLTESCTNPSESDSHVSEHQSGPTCEPDLKKLPRNAEMAREQTQVSSTQGAGEKNSSIAHRVSLDPDPIWVFKLLKKMEKAFMTHFANSMVTIRARWGLQNNYELDQMVAELEQDVSSRLQDSVKKELRKIQSRAGRKESKPLREALQWETSLQTEQRRRRLHDLRNLSAFTEQTRVSGLLSLALQDEIPLNCTPGTELTGKAEEEEFCPCEACIRKKVGPTFLRDTIGTGSAPIKKAFDLQQILQNKKEGCTNGEAAKRTFENGELGLLHNSPARTRTVQGADGGLEPGLGLCSGSDEGDKDEGNQKLSRVEDLELKEAEGASYQEGEEDPGAQKRDRKTDTSIGNDLEEEEWEEQGVNEKEENLNEGSGNEDNLEGEVSGKGERGSGREGDGIDAVKAQEAEGEEQTESEDKKEDSSPVSQEESQLGNCSEVSQKGSEEEHSSGDTSNTADEPKEVPHPDRKVTRMYLESSASEQEGAHSGPSTLDQEADENPDLEGRKIVKSLTFTKLVDRTDEFGQDDLDF
ncbi:retinitis pigmentosa 1-like 1 protein [Orycteropus afer afer]|uniref:Retinitis pigmentosa 1-like 1 protein n=1 Tax=Orycteropus afer afer TaxID=1230840 RepID=A0A8B6ZPC2_ORYAF|nr:retinitis pigmentosa 1-like 1 protein [Orycteropus afer afer]